MIKCNYCKNNFLNERSLYAHQRTTKYCLTLQGKEQKTYDCKNCNKSFLQKKRLENHLNKCKIDINQQLLEQKTLYDKQLLEQKAAYDNQLLEQKNDYEKRIAVLENSYNISKQIIEKQLDQISDLNHSIENIAIQSSLKPSSYINNTYNNIEPLSDSHLKTCAERLTEKDVYDINSLADFAAKNSFKNRVVTTDRSRKIFAYKDEDGTIKKDPNGNIVSKKFFGSIVDREEIFDNAIQKNIELLSNKDGNGPEFQNLLIVSSEIINIKNGVIAVAKNDKEHDIKNQFVNKISKFL